MQNEIAHWVLPDGRCVSWSVAELAEKRPDELIDLKAKGYIDEAQFESLRAGLVWGG